MNAPDGYREEFRVVYMREGWTRPGERDYKNRETCESFVAVLRSPLPEIDEGSTWWPSHVKRLLWTRIDSRLVGPWHKGDQQEAG